MQEKRSRISFAIIKSAFLPLIIIISLSVGFHFYKVKIIPLMPERLALTFGKYITTIFIISIAFLMQRIAGGALRWFAENVAAKTATKVDDKLLPILRKFLKVLIWIIAVVTILPLYGVNISALIATLGVGSLAIALAAQDTIANIIAGTLIMIDMPFRIGDKIKLPSGENVEVLEIGARRSKFLSEDKSAIIIVPNLDLSKSKIVNYTYAIEKEGKNAGL